MDSLCTLSVRVSAPWAKISPLLGPCTKIQSFLPRLTWLCSHTGPSAPTLQFPSACSVTAIFFHVPPPSSSSSFLCLDTIPNSSSSNLWFLIILYLSILPFPSFFLLLIRAFLSFSNQASVFEIVIHSLLLSFLVLHMTAPWVKKKKQNTKKIPRLREKLAD